ncbi:MAG TPA: hypothetical protein VKA87_11900 [Nitrososphaeraceae archaeon]|nr:hypothetical protein [Nitrososphaeraceae archaeon]
MALGELIYEHTGRMIGQRVLSVKEEERPKIESSFQLGASSKELMLQKRQHIGVFLDLVEFFMVRRYKE